MTSRTCSTRSRSHDVLQLLVEGGPTTASAFLDAGLVNHIVWYQSASFAGSDGTLGALHGLSTSTICGACAAVDSSDVQHGRGRYSNRRGGLMALSTIEEAIEQLRQRRHGRRRRRRGPRERGRPHHAGPGRHAREHGLLPRVHLGRLLRADRVGARRRAGPAPDGGGEHRGPAHGLHRDRRLPPRHLDRNLGQ